MNAQGLSREAALRIGLAARRLPDTEPAQLMKALLHDLNVPITEEKLGAITVRKLQSVGDGLLSQVPLPALKQALDCLWGKEKVSESGVDIPVPQFYKEGDMPGSICVAVASNNGELLDGHFGTCARFLIYQVSSDMFRLIAVRSTVGADEAGDDKNDGRAQLIADCQLLMVVSIGGPAAAKVVKRDIHPIKKPDGGSATALMLELSATLKENPPPWLARIMGRSVPQRWHVEEAE
ncbi:MAG TPA: dinitrogenase iron-molybdenum cofactor biosynthesis protein [Gammaproteobacteria bacterium]